MLKETVIVMRVKIPKEGAVCFKNSSQSLLPEYQHEKIDEVSRHNVKEEDK